MKNFGLYFLAVVLTVVLFLVGLGAGSVISDPCLPVHNQVSYPAGVVRDANDLKWDIQHLGKKNLAAWEGRVLYCTLK